MNKFKIGDLLIAKKSASKEYTITKKDSVVKIMDIVDDVNGELVEWEGKVFYVKNPKHQDKIGESYGFKTMNHFRKLTKSEYLAHSL
jgi:hypothetical protein